MAIVNVTPDSFSGDGLLGTDAQAAILAAVQALDGGADIVDLGAESTRPDAEPISAEVEQRRILPVLQGVRRLRPNAVISVDTYHAATARAAAEEGAEIINDVSGLEWDPGMAHVVAETGCGLVLMHTRGRPGEWKTQTRLTSDEILPLVFAGLCERLVMAEAKGVASSGIVVDPGFGFGKLGRENFTLLAGLGRLAELGRPLLIGLSRKGFLAEPLRAVRGVPRPMAQERRLATVSANVGAVLAGAHLLRVHDVEETREAVAVADAVLAEVEQVTIC